MTGSAQMMSSNATVERPRGVMAATGNSLWNNPRQWS